MWSSRLRHLPSPISNTVCLADKGGKQHTTSHYQTPPMWDRFVSPSFRVNLEASSMVILGMKPLSTMYSLRQAGLVSIHVHVNRCQYHIHFAALKKNFQMSLRICNLGIWGKLMLCESWPASKSSVEYYFRGSCPSKCSRTVAGSPNLIENGYRKVPMSYHIRSVRKSPNGTSMHLLYMREG